MIKEIVQTFLAGVLVLLGGKVEDPFVSGMCDEIELDDEQPEYWY